MTDENSGICPVRMLLRLHILVNLPFSQSTSSISQIRTATFFSRL